MSKIIIQENIELDIHQNKKALYILRSINHTLRLQILEYINHHSKVTVTEIYKDLKLQQAVASQHLAVLRRANFVVTIKEKKFVYYSLNSEYLQHFQETINFLFHKK